MLIEIKSLQDFKAPFSHFKGANTVNSKDTNIFFIVIEAYKILTVGDTWA